MRVVRPFRFAPRRTAHRPDKAGHYEGACGTVRFLSLWLFVSSTCNGNLVSPVNGAGQVIRTIRDETIQHTRATRQPDTIDMAQIIYELPGTRHRGAGGATCTKTGTGCRQEHLVACYISQGCQLPLRLALQRLGADWADWAAGPLANSAGCPAKLNIGDDKTANPSARTTTSRIPLVTSALQTPT